MFPASTVGVEEGEEATGEATVADLEEAEVDTAHTEHVEGRSTCYNRSRSY